MKHDDTKRSGLAEQVSAAMDGDAPAADVVVRAWKNQSAVRTDWHAYQLIGDVLRSADCASPASRDEALLQRVRQRLAAEPVVLAPARLPAARKRSVWLAPAAVAAGFVAVVGLVVLQPQKDAGQGAAVTAAAGGNLMPVGQAGFQPREATAAPALASVASAASGAPGGPVMIRSAELDRYLAAHKQFAATSAVPAPGVVVRSVSTVAPSR